MRISHVITKGDVGGAQTNVVELASAQVRAGDDVVVTAGSDGPALERAAAAGARVELVPEVVAAREGGGSLRSAYGALAARLGDIAPDVVHGHSSHAGLLARAASRRLGLPSVYTAHGWPFQPGAPWRQRVSSYAGETVGAWLGDVVICLTESEARAARWVVPSSRMRIVPNGIADVSADELRPSGRSADGPVRLVMVARFAPPKQQAALLQALADVADVAWELTFVGEGPGRTACEQIAAARFGDGRVSFAGHRDDVPALLARHDVAVLWSGYEGMPMALLEGMRAGLCCLANDLPGVRVLFGTDHDLEPAGVIADADGLPELVRRWADDRDDLDRWGQRARQRYLDAFTADAMAAAVRQAYDDAIARRPLIGRRRGPGGGTSAR
ncbi:MAG: glycosyltransferase [Ilumatobacter sp.]|nr:glycosyltransferase [Ilumatobacter sp.]